jgi:hypothetical protein
MFKSKNSNFILTWINNKAKYYFKKIYVFFFSATSIKKSKLLLNAGDQTIGVAIPMVGHHSKYLDQLLTFISHSELLPDEVSISISSTLYSKFDFNHFPFKIIITQTRIFQNASQNRNTAARKLNTNIISFFDADDLPHIKRLSFIKKAFSEGSSVCVHNYLQGSERNSEFPYSEIGEIKFHHNSINAKGVNCLTPVCNYSHQEYACGHISIKKDIFKRYKFNESKLYHGKEDAEFATRLVENKIFVSYIENKLSYYMRRFDC